MEPRHVAGRAEEAALRRGKLRLRHRHALQPIGLIGVNRGHAVCLVRRKEEERVFHFKRLEDSFVQKSVVGLARRYFDDAAESGDADVAVIPCRSGLE